MAAGIIGFIAGFIVAWVISALIWSREIVRGLLSYIAPRRISLAHSISRWINTIEMAAERRNR